MSKIRITALMLAMSALFFSCIKLEKKAPAEEQSAEPEKPQIEAVTECTEEDSHTQVSLRDGVVGIAVDKQQLFALGMVDESDYRIDRESQKVTTTGNPCSVFIGNIGQECNPIVCILTDDGKVEIMSVYSAVTTGNFITSGPLYGFNDIVKFKTGAVTNDYGIGYGTIFAINSKGEEKEIPLWDYSGDLFHFYGNRDGSISMTFLKLSTDWRIAISKGWFESELAGQNLGRFWEIEPMTEQSPGKYGFELTEQFSFSLDEEDGEPKPKKVNLSGEFTFFTGNDGVFTLTSIKGQPIAADINEPAEFSIDSYPTFKNSVGVERSRVLEYKKAYGK
ncbi:MAG: hypothetical protein J6Y87_03475 [Muribaculaceae bacterium]|nr:hypothetical protein [Muribaculaceae bacterium]